MKAVVQDRYGPPDVLELRDIDPPTIGDDDVLVRVLAAGVDPGVWHLMTGLPYLVRLLGYGLRAPKQRVRGTDLAGRIEAVGRGVTRFQVGDDVFGGANGSFAEYACVKEKNCARKPGNLSFEQAAAVPVSGVTALQGVRETGEVRAGHRVLVIGAGGGVGHFAVQIARALGASVTGVCSARKVELVRSIGADDVIDYTHEDVAHRPQRYDVIIDTAGNRPLRLLRSLLTEQGTLVIVGGEGGDRWLGGTDRQLRALVMSRFVRHNLRSFIGVLSVEHLTGLKGLIEAGKVMPVIDRTYPLAETAEAIRHLTAGRALGKVVIRVADA